VPTLGVSIDGVSGAIYLSVNTTTDWGRKFNGSPDEETVDIILLKKKMTKN